MVIAGSEEEDDSRYTVYCLNPVYIFLNIEPAATFTKNFLLTSPDCVKYVYKEWLVYPKDLY